jgi:cyanate lyase
MLKVTEHDAQTNTTVVRDMTQAEIDQKNIDASNDKIRLQLTAQANAAKQSARAKLAALGLNDEEIYALLGI